MAETNPRGPQWWLLQDGAPTGPFSHADVESGVLSGRILPGTLASPVGSVQWRPLREWESFAAGQPAEPQAPPLQSPWPINVGKRSTVTRATQLPEMARWICAYSLFVSPVLWLINQGSCMATSPLFDETSPLLGFELLIGLMRFVVSLAVVALLLAGAIWLQRGKRLGVWLLISGLGLDIGWFVLELMVMALLMSAAAQDAGQQHLNPAEAGHPQLGMVLCAFTLVAGIFEVVSLIWLLTKGRDLHLE